ncbi:hypothetical protein B0H14DRAFT_3878517 [Mycena olivaceomarginata]|nr:hypothetical protein B0H14DRAFT_3878517 [Mycena olivaceomarginata]
MRYYVADMLVSEFWSSGKSGVLEPSRGECILELVSMSARAAGVICDAPVLNVMTPVIEITTMICDMEKRVKSNREVALALAAHASAVTKCIVERASTDGEATAHNAEALEALNLVLEDIHSYLTILSTRHGRMTSWVLANQQKDRFAQLATALDKALALFTSTQVLSTKYGVRSHTHTLDALVTTVGRLDNNLTFNQWLNIYDPISSAPHGITDLPALHLTTRLGYVEPLNDPQHWNGNNSIRRRSGVDPRHLDSFQVSSPISLFHFAFGFQQIDASPFAPVYGHRRRSAVVICATTPAMNTYQPLVASAVEICASANLIGSAAADSLASFAVSQTSILINGMTQSLALFEQNWTTSGDILSRFQGELAREIG